MVGVIDDDQFVFTGQRSNELANFAPRAVLIISAMDKELWLRAAPQVSEIGVVHRDAEANQLGHMSICTANTKSHPTAKTETGQKYGSAGKFRGKKIDGGLHVALLTSTTVVRTRAQTRATKIEPQDRNTEGIQGFGGPVDDLVVERAAIQGVRVANHGRERGRNRMRGGPENGLQTADGPFQE